MEYSGDLHVHPARLSVEELRRSVDMTFTRRSGPGGQHRNKVETAVVVVHRPSGVKAEASERRSQAQNRAVAMTRLRIRLAIEVRCTTDGNDARSGLWKSRCVGGRILINPEHEDFPALLAEALDVLHAAGWDPRTAAEQLTCSTTQLLKLLRLAPEALVAVNRERVQVGLGKLT